MPSLIDIRRRIRSVKSTQQITKAMKMMSAARLRRAQERVIAARPYSNMLDDVLRDVAAAAAESDGAKDLPLLAEREEKRIQLVLLTSDRGLAGSFNSNLIKAGQRFIDQHKGKEILIEAVGRRGRDFFKKRNYTLTGEHVGLIQRATYGDAQEIANGILARYSKQEIDAVYLLFNTFRSVVSQELTVKKILPMPVPKSKSTANFIFEQSPEHLLGALIPRYFTMQVYRAIVESAAAEHAARMTAMDAASTNAAEVIDKLTLYMNRVRQASITREIIEVVSGAAALE